MDLLLIIVFAQYMEFHVTQENARRESQTQIEIAKQTWQKDLLKTTNQLQTIRDQFSRQRKELQDERDASLSRAAEANLRSELAEKLVKRFATLDPKIIDTERSPAEVQETVANAKALSKRIEDMDSSEVLRFLVSYDELLKRADIWTIHVSDRGDVEFVANDSPAGSHDFRLEGRTQQARSKSFIDRMRAEYLQMQEPQGTVILLVSYSPRAIAGNYQSVLDGLPELLDTLAADFGGRTRFEFSVVGAMVDPKHDLPR
tara:strand:- start:320753 stop:321529 length:777 start_codon:yes stop_codon:yes gene_type:complete